MKMRKVVCTECVQQWGLEDAVREVEVRKGEENLRLCERHREIYIRERDEKRRLDKLWKTKKHSKDGREFQNTGLGDALSKAQA